MPEAVSAISGIFPDASEDCCLKVVEQDHRKSSQIDTKIQQCQREYIIRHIQLTKQRDCDQFADDCGQYAAYQRRYDGCMDRIVRHGVILFSYRMSNRYICAQRDSDKQVDDQADDRTVRTDRCHSGRPKLAGKITDNGNIRSIEELT